MPRALHKPGFGNHAQTSPIVLGCLELCHIWWIPSLSLMTSAQAEIVQFWWKQTTANINQALVSSEPDSKHTVCCLSSGFLAWFWNSSRSMSSFSVCSAAIFRVFSHLGICDEDFACAGVLIPNGRKTFAWKHAREIISVEECKYGELLHTQELNLYSLVQQLQQWKFLRCWTCACKLNSELSNSRDGTSSTIKLKQKKRATIKLVRKSLLAARPVLAISATLLSTGGRPIGQIANFVDCFPSPFSENHFFLLSAVTTGKFLKNAIFKRCEYDHEDEVVFRKPYHWSVIYSIQS